MLGKLGLIVPGDARSHGVHRAPSTQGMSFSSVLNQEEKHRGSSHVGDVPQKPHNRFHQDVGWEWPPSFVGKDVKGFWAYFKIKLADLVTR